MPYTLLMKHCTHCPWSDHWKHLSCDSKDHTARNSHMNNILHQLMHSGCPHLSLLHSALKPCSKVVSCISINLLSSYKWHTLGIYAEQCCLQRTIRFEYIHQWLEASLYHVNQSSPSLGHHSETIAIAKLVTPKTAPWRPYLQSTHYNG